MTRCDLIYGCPCTVLVLVEADELKQLREQPGHLLCPACLEPIGRGAWAAKPRYSGEDVRLPLVAT